MWCQEGLCEIVLTSMETVGCTNEWHLKHIHWSNNILKIDWVETNDNKEFWHHWAKAETEKVEGEEKAFEKT